MYMPAARGVVLHKWHLLFKVTDIHEVVRCILQPMTLHAIVSEQDRWDDNFPVKTVVRTKVIVLRQAEQGVYS